MSDTRGRKVAPREWTGRVLLVALLLMAAAAGIEAGESATYMSRTGALRVSYTSKLQPIAINRIHSWIVHIESADGNAVANATIAIDGGMPQHDHGLATAPEVTRYLGDGDYLVEGLRFHMNGEWEVTLAIDTVETRDTVIIPLTL